MKMKIFAKIVVSILIGSSFAGPDPALAAGAEAADELLQDPGFEELNPGPLKIYAGIWAINGAYPGSAIIIEDAKGAHSGKHYLAVSKTDETKGFVSVLESRYYPNDGPPYLFKIWAKGSGKILLGLINYKGSEFISPTEKSEPKWLELSDDWKEFSVTLSADKSSTKVMFFVHVINSADLDDASLKSVDEPKK